jgi:protein TonB
MALRAITWLVSFGVHAAFALFMLMPTGGASYEEGTGEDIMVVEQGIAVEGFAKLGEDLVTTEEVLAPPVQTAVAQPLPEQVKPPVEELPTEEVVEEVQPVLERQVIASETGPDQEDVRAPDPENVDEPEPDDIKEPVQDVVKEHKPKEEVKKEEVTEQVVNEIEPDKVEQKLPQQVATVTQESVVATRESSGQEKKGGDTTAHLAYLGKLRSHLERNKVNPRTTFKGTAVIHFSVNAKGEITSRRIAKSSGSKILDDAALAAVDRSSPFPEIPDTLNREKIEVSVPFRFTVR